jgi:hypothetical protein
MSPKHWVEAAIQNSNERIEKAMYEAFENSLAQVRFFNNLKLLLIYNITIY